ncbi:DUF305 domain-containing protein [Actinocorallia populi]|uniref:DUF305 domain-containing protein n=1 Tax=Actinocorallia populi TaxID=2079200 RepID=UPI000D08FD98|nr:DUF305 domain-containing protein [Actinocorallia populi]
MNLPGRLFQAVALLVIGATAALLLDGVTGSDTGPGEPGRVDIGFAQDMIVHHQQAVTMAQTVQDGAGDSVRRLAVAIELNQLREIGHMQGWLALWDAPQLPSGPPMAWMGEHPEHASAGEGMTGLATQDELDRLGGLEGEDLDALFLRLMIRHHEGGLLMTAAASRDAAVPHVRAFAKILATEQRRETATMAGLLAALDRPAPPAPN